MARIFVPREKLLGSRATLDAAAHRHLVKVLRLGPGAKVDLFDGAGTEIEAIIESVGKACVEMTLGKRRELPRAACTITLLQSLPRGDRMDLIVQKTTELGVAAIVPVLSEHGVAKPPSDRRRRWQTIAEEAARQCGRADVPEVAEPALLGPTLAHLASSRSARYLIWEGERERSLFRALENAPSEVCLLVGPEGGFSDAEVGESTRSGFVTAGLGPRILRSETAAIVAVSLAQARAGGLDPL